MATRRSRQEPQAKERHEDDPRFQVANWRFQRGGWIAVTLLLLLAVAGVLGDGPLSAREAGAPGGLRVRYHRVLRMEAEERLDLEVPAGPNGTASLVLDEAFAGRVDIDKVSPEPERIEALPDGRRMFFAVRGEGSVPVHIQFFPKKLGSMRVRLAGGDAPPLSLGFFVLP